MFGTVKNEGGMIFSGNNFKVVKKVLKSGEQISLHNHESDNIVLSVLKGKMEMYLNDTEKHVLVPPPACCAGRIAHGDTTKHEHPLPFLPFPPGGAGRGCSGHRAAGRCARAGCPWRGRYRRPDGCRPVVPATARRGQLQHPG